MARLAPGRRAIWHGSFARRSRNRTLTSEMALGAALALGTTMHPALRRSVDALPPRRTKVVLLLVLLSVGAMSILRLESVCDFGRKSTLHTTHEAPTAAFVRVVTISRSALERFAPGMLIDIIDVDEDTPLTVDGNPTPIWAHALWDWLIERPALTTVRVEFRRGDAQRSVLILVEA